MAADIAQVLRILRYRDISVRMVDGRLVARYRHGAMPADMYSFIAHFKDRLVAYLLEEERLAETVTNILALSDEERDEYRRLIVGNHPEVTPHDREAWLRAQAQIEIDQEIAA